MSPVDHEMVAAVLRSAAVAKGRTDWMESVLGSSHIGLREWATDHTDPRTGPRELLLRAAEDVYDRMVTPPDELVDVVVRLVNERIIVGRRS